MTTFKTGDLSKNLYALRCKGSHGLGNRTVAGILAVCLSVAFGRWGSYLGKAPLFLTDFLVTAALSNSILAWLSLRRRKRGSLHLRAPVLLLGLGTYALVRLLAGWELGFLAVRDGAPYVYAIFGLVGWAGAGLVRDSGLTRGSRYLEWALRLHVLWLSVALVSPDVPLSLPVVSVTQEIHILTPRSDFDTAISGAFLGILMVRVLSGQRRRLDYMWLGLCFLVILMSPSRAGLLGAASAVALCWILLGCSKGLGRYGHTNLAVLTIIIIVMIILVLPHTKVGLRLTGTYGSSASEEAMNARGTTEARSSAWPVVVAYTMTDTRRSILGVGFGSDFMCDSGAAILLNGSFVDGPTATRSPHNYWIGTLARLGIIGLALVLTLSATLLTTLFRARRRLVKDDFLLTTSLIPVALLLPATFGVVLESPFGAVPFFWCVGVVFRLAGQT